MTTISYEAGLHRLRVEGACRGSDLPALEEALAAFEKPHAILTVDLTAVTELAPEAAALLVAARDEAPSRGCEIALIRKAGSDVDWRITCAEPERHPGEE
jgi:ABC-type transporter Mla MlaB component